MERASDNPWPQWPKVYKLDYGQEEAAARFGDDPRLYLVQTKKFTGDEAGRVKEMHTVRIEWVKDNGRFAPREIPGSEQVFPVQIVPLAMGFLGPENQLLDKLGVEKDRLNQRQGRPWQVPDEPRQSIFAGRRYAPRAEFGRLGDQ